MDEIIKSVILGAVQGFTEFLPISSSGHLVIVSHLLKFESPGALFETILHLGTISSVAFYYRSYLLKIKFSEIKLFVYATIPAAIFGLLLKSPIESLFDSTRLVAVAFLVTATINFYLDRLSGKKQDVDGWEAWAMGFAQSIALIPGISRSGSTILAGKAMKLSTESVTRFSLLMSIPVIIGANFLEIYTHGLNLESNFYVYISGFVMAFTTGLFAISLLLSMLKLKKMKYFSVYLIILAFVVFFI